MSSAEMQGPPARVSLLGRLETVLLCCLLLGSIALAALQIVLRNVFSYSLFWADEAIRMAILWLAMIGAMVASGEGRHIAISIVPRYCPVPWHRPASIVSMGFAAIVSGLLAWQSLRFVADSWRYGDSVLGGLPAWAFQSIMPVGFTVICFRFLRRLLLELERGR